MIQITEAKKERIDKRDHIKISKCLKRKHHKQNNKTTGKIGETFAT